VGGGGGSHPRKRNVRGTCAGISLGRKQKFRSSFFFDKVQRPEVQRKRKGRKGSQVHSRMEEKRNWGLYVQSETSEEIEGESVKIGVPLGAELLE